MTRTLFLGLDGATFTVLDPLMERGVMPFLRGFIDGGVRATLRTIVPPLTPPAWTSLMTGKRPGRHGVFDFFQKETPESHFFKMANSGDVGSATMWSLASDAGLRISALNFPLMFPPPAVNGAVVPGGWMPWRQLRLGCAPPGLFDRLKALPSFNPREMAFDMELEVKAVEGCAADEYADWVRLHTRREQRWLEISRFLMQEEPADLFGIVFDGVDKLQHLCWRFLDPAFRPAEPTAWEREVMDLCDDYFRQLDGILAELVALAGPDATVVMGSDHGFAPTFEVLYLNTWLEQQGFLAWNDGTAATDAERPPVGFNQIGRHVNQIDWSRTVAYAASPTNQGIHLVSQYPDGTPVPAEVYLATRAAIVAGLRELRHPETGLPLVEEIWTRDEVFDGPFKPLGPDLTLRLANAAMVSIVRSDSLLQPRPKVEGFHRWDGIFLARGPEVRSGVTLDELSILDVTPLILYSLDLPIPADVEGRVPGEIFVAGRLDEHPPVSATPAPAAGAADMSVAGIEVAFDAEEEELVIRRLRALGYVE